MVGAVSTTICEGLGLNIRVFIVDASVSRVQTLVTLEAFVVSDGYSMGWDCLPDSLKDGEMRIDWKGMTESQRKDKLIVFAYYLDGPFEGRAYRPRESDRGKYIVRDGKKVYLYVLEF